MFITLWIGCILVGLMAAIPTYYLVRQGVNRVRARRTNRRKARMARVLKRLANAANDHAKKDGIERDHDSEMIDMQSRSLQDDVELGTNPSTLTSTTDS